MAVTSSDITGALGADSMKTVLDGIYNDTQSLQDAVPLPSDSDITGWGADLLNHTQAANDFVEALMTRIGLTVFKSKILTNPLAPFKKGQMPLGQTIQEIFTDLATSKKFNLESSGTDMFKLVRPDVKAYYHDLNRNDVIPLSITEDNLRTAFVSWSSLGSFVAQQINAMYNRNNVDEFGYMKRVLDKTISSGNMSVVKVPKPTKDNASDIITTIKAYSNKLTFPSRFFNGAGVMTQSTKDEQDLFVTADTDALFDVAVLANAFNMDKASFMGHKHMIDGLQSAPNLVALLVDRDFFMVWDQLIKMTNTYVASGLYWNDFLFVRQVMSASLLANAIAFKYDTADNPVPDITSVVVSPMSSNLKAGSTLLFHAYVKQTVDDQDLSAGKWSIEGATASDTTIDADSGLLTIGASETVGNNITIIFTTDHKNSDTDTTGVQGKASVIITA